mgnify:CR=1 FL=1
MATGSCRTASEGAPANSPRPTGSIAEHGSVQTRVATTNTSITKIRGRHGSSATSERATTGISAGPQLGRMDTCTDNEWGARHRGNLAGLNAGQATSIEMTEATGMVEILLRINYSRQGNFRQAMRASEETGHKGGGGVRVPRMRAPSHSTMQEPPRRPADCQVAGRLLGPPIGTPSQR